MAIAVLDTLEVPHDLSLELPETVLGSRRDVWGEHAVWARASLGPWVHRRVTGRSSGDTVAPRWPTLGRPD